MLYILTSQKLKWWTKEITTVCEKTGKKIKDINGTQTEQLNQIHNLFENNEIQYGDDFLVCDIWFPGIEIIRYLSQLKQIQVNIWGVWHGGSSTSNSEIEPMHSWSKHFEVGFLNICNGIFVGSEYSKQSIANRLLYFISEFESKSILDRIYSDGMPLRFKELQQYCSKKENIIVFPNAPEEENAPDTFVNIIQGLSMYWDDFSDYKFIFCSEREYKSSSRWLNALLSYLKSHHQNVEILENLTAENYYKTIGKAKIAVATSTEENFGYPMVESMALGCNVLLPNSFSYPEIVESNSSFLYDKVDDILIKLPYLTKHLEAEKTVKGYVLPYSNVIDRWLSRMET